MNILVVGCGLMGPAIAKDCAQNKEVTHVEGCDIDEEQLKRCLKIVSNNKFETSILNLNNYEALVKKMKGFDVVVNASASQFSLNILKASMEIGCNLVDLTSAHYPLEGELYDEVKNANITAIPGCGVDPGLIDILAGYGMDLMDEVEEVYFACGGLPLNPQPPLDYKIVFGGKRMPIRPGKVPVILNSAHVKVDRYSEVEPVHIEGFKDMEAFYDGYPSSLLSLCMEKGVKTFKGKTIRYKGFTDKLQLLIDLGIISEDIIIYQGHKIVPLDFFQELTYPKVRFDSGAGDRDITVLRVRVKGRKDDSFICVMYEMVDFYDEKEKITSMARTTGYTAAIIARMLARGEISQKGIQWPVGVIKGDLFKKLMISLRKRGIDVTETILKTEKL
ncbi:MAG: saccharopine dehydrogenase NADP-binding domain-containing protein [Theionarchaea archaeon]|nr:saccharopine dehydrogenase NADP-binding domain-containing protein [Theionarchaea archaeon]